ncbi:hypothetical protein C8J56DRAFT_889371 [Mycena floridula]|nr:hypothetical protein C8J56DRAFT_889371 [Mycena floridula]
MGIPRIRNGISSEIRLDSSAERQGLDNSQADTLNSKFPNIYNFFISRLLSSNGAQIHDLSQMVYPDCNPEPNSMPGLIDTLYQTRKEEIAARENKLLADSRGGLISVSLDLRAVWSQKPNAVGLAASVVGSAGYQWAKRPSDKRGPKRGCGDVMPVLPRWRSSGGHVDGDWATGCWERWRFLVVIWVHDSEAFGLSGTVLLGMTEDSKWGTGKHRKYLRFTISFYIRKGSSGTIDDPDMQI